MEKLRVLIVDDSVVYRSQIRSALQEIPWVEVVGVASNGRLAIERVKQHDPHLLILDLEMPEMDGLQTLKELNQLKVKCKVLLFSSLSRRGAEVTMEALRLGASDFVTKPGATSNGPSEPLDSPTQKIKELIAPKLQTLFPHFALGAQKDSSLKRDFERSAFASSVSSHPVVSFDLLNPKVIVIGASTGGPTVLERIFSEVTGPLKCPILIAQHMPPLFTTTFAERLARLSGLDVAEAKHGERLVENKIYVAPGDYHLRMEGTPDNVVLMLDQGPQINSVRPAVDALFVAAASIFKDRCLAFVLTGMGSDGKDGAIAVKQAGGTVVIQNEESCIVFGMPGAVYGAGAFDRIASPQEIVEVLKDKAVGHVPTRRVAG